MSGSQENSKTKPEAARVAWGEVAVVPCGIPRDEEQEYGGHARSTLMKTDGLLDHDSSLRSEHTEPSFEDITGLLLSGVSHIVLLALFGISAAFTSSNLWSSEAATVLVLYGAVIGVLSTVRALHVYCPFVRVPPIFLSAAHAAVVVADAQWRASLTPAPHDVWNRAFCQAALLQAFGVAAHPANSAAWFLASVALATTVLVIGLSRELVLHWQVLGDALCGLFALGSAAFIFGRRDATKSGWLESILAALREVGAGRPPITAAQATWSSLEALREGGSNNIMDAFHIALRELQDAKDISPGLRTSLTYTLRNLASRVRVLVNQSNPIAQLDLDGESAAVQHFVRETFFGGSETPSRAVSFTPNGAGQESEESTYDATLESMLRCFKTLQTEVEEIAKPPLQWLAGEAGKWAFDAFELSNRSALQPLRALGGHILKPFLGKLKLQQEAFESFFYELETRYDNHLPYHTSTHAADVLNSMLYLLGLQSTILSNLKPIEQLTACVAAAAHDVGHDGHANRFHTVAGTPLAHLYNDQSCLENLHCALTFAVLRSKGNNFVKNLDAADYGFFRSGLVQMILETDLAKHLQAVTNFNSTFNVKDADKDVLFLDQAKRKQVLSFLLKACDVGASGKPFHLHAAWTVRINAEFFNQGDAEQKRGLPVSPFCARFGTEIAKSQKGFYDFISVPLFDALHSFLMSKRMKLEVLVELKRNHAFWSSCAVEGFDYNTPESNVNLLNTLFWNFGKEANEEATRAKSKANLESDETPGKAPSGSLSYGPSPHPSPIANKKFRASFSFQVS